MKLYSAENLNRANKLMSLKLMRVPLLMPHEEINEKRFKRLLEKIKKNKFVVPIVVDVNSLTILDGHHRVKVIESLKYRNIPAYLLDYEQRTIKVFPRRKNYEVNKKTVISRAINRNLYPPRTTRHIINGLKDWKIPIDLLDKEK